MIFLNKIYESEYKNQCLLKREALGTLPAIISFISLYIIFLKYLNYTDRRTEIWILIRNLKKGKSQVHEYRSPFPDEFQQLGIHMMSFD